MKPIRLTMQSFGSYGNKTVIDFTVTNQNLFLITGDTGAGKSTIFDAIVFALYGEASSQNNKKDGIELQSQYLPLSTQPYVELTFEKKNGGENLQYTVRRSPRHMRPAKKSGAADQVVSETVSLLMPDGSEYPQKETDQKLIGIVGLTKDQFMQVAMIAQGEFMELLRADSNKKKEIFRRLFGTQRYQAIVDAFADRRKVKQGQFARIRTICQQEAARIRIPEGYQDGTALKDTIHRIASSEILHGTDLEQLMKQLKELNEWLCAEEASAEAETGKAKELYQSARDVWTEGRALMESFQQLEQAQKDLKECEEQQEQIRSDGELAGRITAAFEVSACFLRMEDAGKRVLQTERAIDEQKERLPALSRRREEAAAQEKEAQEAVMTAQVRLQQQKMLQRRQEAARAAEVYRAASLTHQRKKREYDEKHAAFLDAQAGYLAGLLEDGKPCPVCGSLSHPAPCPVQEEHKELTRELIEQLAKEAEQERKHCEAASERSGAALLLYEQEKAETEKMIRAAKEQAELTRKQTLPGKDLFDEENIPRTKEAAKELAAKAQRALKHASEAVAGADAACQTAAALLGEYERQLPELKQEAAQRTASYRESMKAHALTEETWKDLTARYTKEDAGALQQKIEAHQKKEAAARGAIAAAGKAVAGHNRPDLALLQQKEAEAKSSCEEKEKLLTQISDMRKIDGNVYDALSPQMEERSRIMEEYTRINSLYERLAGKRKGARMDIESYVQRTYLQRILYAANERFARMSAGQYELRLVEEEKAGEGKNRGLDLMVYSFVTGKEREIRTLSGGESFMAALSLALGMADQIQENAASIDLDMMFIDEGFGSLDEHSRDQAVKVLQQMAGSSRLIGIISHVTQLRQEIEDQLQVTKDEEGSHVGWLIS